MVRKPYTADEILQLSKRQYPSAYRDELRRDFNRSLAAHALAKMRNETPERIARKAWGDDCRGIPLLTRAPVSPLSSPVTAVSQVHVGDLLLVAPGSAAAQLFARCMRLDFAGVYQITVPYASSHATPLFAGEALPINVVRSPIATTTVGPVRKLGFITTFTEELEAATPENLAAILGRLLGEAAAKSLDAAVFSTTTADSTRPAGLLAGVTPMTGSTTSATTADAAAADVSAFAQAMSDAFINPNDMVVITSPRSAMNLRMAMGYAQTPLPILMSPAVLPGTAIAIAPEAVASGYDGDPEIIVTKNPPLHFDDSVPADIVSGSGVVASPVMSPFQKGMVALRLMVRSVWASLQPGAVQYTTTAKW
jgi:hypothetical protein